jgi:hypothetical protein
MVSPASSGLPALQQVLHNLGAVKSIAFKGVDLSDGDQYLVDFANGGAFFTMSLDANGKVQTVAFVPVPPSSTP